jgi:4-amino-4-deoxychorismate lyase
MSLLVESLKLKDGRIENPGYHQFRMNRAMSEFFPEAEKINLAAEITVPDHCTSGIFKVRVGYGPAVEKIEIEPYIFRTIRSLKVVHHESIDYHVKFTNRQILQELFAQRGDCDDIIIVKNGFVTDSFAANLLFFDGINWYTSTTPLLRGTRRQFLLDRGMISKKEIREEDIRSYQKVGLVNALVGFDEMPVVPVKRVVFE